MLTPETIEATARAAFDTYRTRTRYRPLDAALRSAPCLQAFELVEDGDADYKPLDAFTLIAQNTWNGGVVLGPAVAQWRRVDLEHAVTRCWVNDQPAGQGKTGDAMGHPLEAVAWLA